MGTKINWAKINTEKSTSTIRVDISNFESVVSTIGKWETAVGEATQRTINEVKSKRGAPAWISQEVSAKYNIPKKDVREAETGVTSAGKIKIGGVTVESYNINHSGRLLTPTHFGMKPADRPKKIPYQITATFFRGKKQTLTSKAFIAGSSGTKVDGLRTGTPIAWRRVSDSRTPVWPVKTGSIPQMIDNKEVNDRIHKRINENLEKRLQHYLAIEMKKVR